MLPLEPRPDYLGKESACQRRGHGSDPCSGKTPRAAEQLSPCTATTVPPCAPSPGSTRKAAVVRSPSSASRKQTPRAATRGSPHTAYSGLISFRIDWFDFPAVQGTLKSLLQHHTSKASVLQRSAFFTVQLSHPYMTTGKTIALTRWTFVAKVMSLLFIDRKSVV